MNDSVKNMYHYAFCGLDSVWLKNGFRYYDTPYGKGVAIEDIEGLHKAIAEQLINKPTHLTGAEFKFLRIELDMSQKRIGELVGKEAQTIANWEKSKELNQDADFLIRHIYKQTVINKHSNYIEMVDYLNNLDKENFKTHFRKAGNGWCVDS